MHWPTIAKSLSGLVIGLAFSLLPCRAAPPDRPNILFIYIDDMGAGDCGFTGTDFYETPHIDRLASDSVVFRNGYAAAANCAPSRACLLTGTYSPRHEIYNVGTGLRGNPKFSRLRHVPGTDTLRPEIVTWAERIRSAGYATGILGKWHLSQDPLDYGFDVNIGGTHAGSPPKGYFPPHPNAPGLEFTGEEEYLTDRLTDEAVSFIEANQTRPWLLYLSHFAVHTPLQAQESKVAKYLEKPKGEIHDHATMAAMIESVDDGVGRLIATLDTLQLTERTIIVFSSDNGGYGPATNMHPLKGYKGTYYEGGLRVPFFIKWPGVIQAGRTSDVPVCNVDLYPTFCEMAGVTLPDPTQFDGISLVPLLAEDRELPERPLYWHFPAYLDSYSRRDEQRDPLFRARPCSVIRLGDWKLIEYFEDGAIELFNLRNDLGEAHNQVNERPALARELHQKLIAWRVATSAPVPTEPNPRYRRQAEAKEIARLSGRLQQD